MKIYYKYSKYFGVKSLENLTLRLSSPSTLNDPFEGMLNENVKERLLNIAKPEDLGMHGYEHFFDKNMINQFIKNKIQNLINRYGVVSLSETPINLLMWAHYANEHQGICIGFKPDLFDSLNKKEKSLYGIESYHPQKVNYDSIRPQNIEDEPESASEIREQARNQLLTKSNDWMYEKEHRCIIPLSWADQYKKIGDNPDIRTEMEFVEQDMLTEVDDYTFEGKGINILSAIFNEEKESVFLKKINPKSVASIYLGCKFDPYEIEKVIDMVTNEHSKLKHIKLYTCSPSKDRFELETKQIHPSRNIV